MPWKIGNTREILAASRSPWLEEQNRWKDNLDENKDGLADGLRMTFELLVDSIALRDMSALDSIAEPNLSEAFYEFFESLDDEEC